MKRKTPSEIIETVSRRENKKNFTYSLSPEVVRRFKEYCKKHRKDASPVLEELIRDFVDCAEKEL